MTKKIYLLIVICFSLMWRPAHAQDAASDLLNRVNTLRVSLGLAPYNLNSALASAAQDQAQWMANTGQVSHTRPDGSTPRIRAANYGYNSNWVSENIYMGGLATVDDAWNFWLNSSIHYSGMTNRQYKEIGVGAASGPEGQAFVLVFGNPNSTQTTATNNDSVVEQPAPPSFVVGVDAFGNIMHEIQPGDTLGDIALIYGYTWEDIPYMLSINNLTEDDARLLEVGSIFLVPPKSGTYTPTPDITGDTTATSDNSSILSMTTPTYTSTPSSPTRAHIESSDAAIVAAVAATLTALAPQTPSLIETPKPLSIISLPTATPLITPTSIPNASTLPITSGPFPLIIIAIIIQVSIIVLASLEFVRRSRQ